MHFFARRSHAHAKVPGCVEKLCHVSSRFEDSVIVAIERFKILSDMLIDLGFEIAKLPRSAAVKLVVNLDGDFLHGFKVAVLFVEVKINAQSIVGKPSSGKHLTMIGDSNESYVTNRDSQFLQC